ncbi:enoyl-CoA hydratase/isomerase family protein [Pendulispora albinea]|uniref:Enoyl-CoA hydratase/isomerase family protein n=1 Tax=Pendulispora albinea TaxID=2741071 RepID=A0ABZ2LJJ5_9BACT
MLRIQRSEGALIWTIARPEVKNALNEATFRALSAAVDDARDDQTVRCVILTGEGDAFCAGGDLNEVRDITSQEATERFARLGEELCSRLEALEVPVLAAIPGVAYGGGAELALACDMRIADASARLSFKQVRMGVTSAWGTVPRLLATVGTGNAARLLFTAQEISAHEAHALHLVDTVCQDGACLSIALGWANDIARGSPRAVAEMKALLRIARTNPAAVRDEERARFIATWTAPDHAEAVAAYFQRRAPRFAPRG